MRARVRDLRRDIISDINTVTLVGRVGREPELRPAGSTKVCTVGLANSRHRKVGDNFEEETSWFDIDFWGDTAQRVAERVKPGHRLAISGRLKQDSYTAKDGTKRNKVRVVADKVQFLEKAGAGGTKEDDGVPF